MSHLSEKDITLLPPHIQAQVRRQLAQQERQALVPIAEPAPAAEPQDRAKYSNVKCEIDGVTFDSKREGKRYQRLKAMQIAGSISGLEIQPEYEIEVNGVSIGSYWADFRYTWLETGEKVVEDVKGVRTDVYRLKKKIVEALYGIKIREV